jgi:hypothetical protein
MGKAMIIYKEVVLLEQEILVKNKVVGGEVLQRICAPMPIELQLILMMLVRIAHLEGFQSPDTTLLHGCWTSSHLDGFEHLVV